MKTKHTSKSRLLIQQGFSLAEVALAVAIAGAALLSVVGLMPVIMESERSSSSKSMLPQLASQAMGKLMSLPYPESLPHEVEMHFSETGELLENSDLAFYKASATLKEATPTTTGTDTALQKAPAPMAPGSNFCMVTISLRPVTAPNSPPMIFHASISNK